MTIQLLIFTKDFLLQSFEVYLWLGIACSCFSFAKMETRPLGPSYHVWMDHCSLKYSFPAYWIMKLLLFDFTTVYKARKDNLGADSLTSSYWMLNFWLVLLLYQWMLPIGKALQPDTYTSDIIKPSAKTFLTTDFHLVDQKLYFKGRLVVPDQSSLRQKFHPESHNTPSVRHVGYLKTLKHLSSNFYWARMKHDAKLFVQNYLVWLTSQIPSF